MRQDSIDFAHEKDSRRYLGVFPVLARHSQYRGSAVRSALWSCLVAHPTQIPSIKSEALGDTSVSRIFVGRRRERSPHPELSGEGKRSRT
eukprot:6396297-Amphidinium_carterae.2